MEQRQAELMDPECIGLMCELHKKMINDAKADEPTDPFARDGKARGPRRPGGPPRSATLGGDPSRCATWIRARSDRDLRDQHAGGDAAPPADELALRVPLLPVLLGECQGDLHQVRGAPRAPHRSPRDLGDACAAQVREEGVRQARQGAGTRPRAPRTAARARFGGAYPSHLTGALLTRAQTSYERKEVEWKRAEITTKKVGGDLGGNIDNWMAKQGNN